MYRPKSPTASSKTANFSPSPQSRRKINNTKTHIQQQIINTRYRPTVSPYTDQKIQKKSPITKKSIFRNIEVESFHTLESFKNKELANNNQTPKFCVKPDQPKCFGQAPRANPLASSNFFSFGQKFSDKIKTQRKKQVSQKEIAKSPKEPKKRPNNNLVGPKNKQQIGIFYPEGRQKKTNQSYLR